ncbi:twin-arginine translocation signal domain-containing protein [Nonomuraea rubra]|uniref:twin-arginine translocation signal domain-containing protein n=1 Tax=Nonomuraea rubra TaxID=46180 RepID=UPI0033C9E301
MTQINRRQALRAALVAGAAVGAGALAVQPARADDDRAGTLGHHLPPVPGMHGDRRANELWYVYEQDFYLQPSPEVIAAYQAVGAVAGGSIEGVLYLYRGSRQYGTYPDKFVERLAPARDALALLSGLQLGVLHRYYRHSRLDEGFYYLGEGTCYDPRMPDGGKVHMMNTGPNGEPAVNWHLWHAIARAMTLLDVDARAWTSIDPMIGLGWAAQSVAQPKPETVNPPLEPRVRRRLFRQWRGVGPDEMDVRFDSVPYPPEIP